MLLSATAVAVTLTAPFYRSDGDAGNAGRLAVLEQKLAAYRSEQNTLAATPERRVMPAGDSQAGDFAGLSARLEQQAAAMEELRRNVQALQATMPGTTSRAAEPETGSQPLQPESSGLSRRLDDLERSSITALGTLDEQLQAIAGDLAALRQQDLTLANELENTRVALEAELAQWRERHTPPLWRMSARLAGQTVQFSEGNRLADEPKTEALLRRIAAWLMEAEPEIGLRIVGYADIDGSGEQSNRITSQKRANAVREMMLGLGIPENRLIAVGRSTEDRLVDDDSSGNLNRRVAFEPFLRASSPP